MTEEPTQNYIGCISGTSVDGLDIAMISIDPVERISIPAAATVPLPEELRAKLLDLGQPGGDDLDTLGWCDLQLGAFIGEAVSSFMRAHAISAADITAIGSHGQTVRHRPPDADHTHGFSLQIGDPNTIAEVSGLTTVADFRRRDMAAGGQGAPLVPPFHQALFGAGGTDTAILNIGGISNLSLLGAVPSGFDTGPGNALLDSWCLQHRGQTYDADGAWAASGRIDTTLLNVCLSDPYFSQAPPKSTGREYFNLAWLSERLSVTNATPADVQATLCALTARCTADALSQWAPDTKTLVVCGGGRLNPHLMQVLQDHTAIQVQPSEALGVDGDSIEAALFGWLAHRCLTGAAGNEPAVTGAKGHRVLGVIYPAQPG